MNQRPGKRRTIHTYSSNVSRNSIYLINQQQKRRKEKTLRMLKKDIIEKSFTSSKAIERVSFFLQTFIQLLQNHADEYLSCRQLIQNQFQTILYDVSIPVNFIFPRLFSYFAAYDSISSKRKRPDSIFELYGSCPITLNSVDG